MDSLLTDTLLTTVPEAASLGTFEIVLISIAGLSLLLAFFMMYRNTAVFTFRMQIIAKVSEMAQLDIANKKEWQWRYDIQDRVSYDYMMYRFWIPLKVENFWDDLSFIRE